MQRLSLGRGCDRRGRSCPSGRSQSSPRLCPPLQRSPAAASASDSCCHPVTNCSNRRRGTWGQSEESRRERPPTLILSPSTENPLGSPGETHRFWLLRKTHGWDITWPQGKHSSRGWENHGASWVWGPRKTRMTGPREALPSFAGVPRLKCPPRSNVSRLQGRLLSAELDAITGTLETGVPEAAPILWGPGEGVKRLHHPIGRGGRHRGCHSCSGWTFLEAEFSTLFPKHTLQCGLILHSEMNHFVYFLYSVLTRGGSPEPSRTEKDLGCRPSME